MTRTDLRSLDFLQRCDFNLIASAGSAQSLQEPTDPKGGLFYGSLERLGHRKPTVTSCIDFRFWEGFLEHMSAIATGESERSEVYLTMHHDCGACGGAARFEHDETKEREFHRELLRAASYNVRTKTFNRSGVSELFVGSQFKTRDAYNCDAMVIACAENGHWQDAFRAVRREQRVDAFDIVTVYGGPSVMMHSKHLREILVENIAVARRLHNINRVYLAGHNIGTCGMSLNRIDLENSRTLLQELARTDERLQGLRFKTLWTTPAYPAAFQTRTS